VRHEHAPAAVAGQAQRVQGVPATGTPSGGGAPHSPESMRGTNRALSPFTVLRLQQVQVGVPLVADHLCEAKVRGLV
jgi:hypothetical protein